MRRNIARGLLLAGVVAVGGVATTASVIADESRPVDVVAVQDIHAQPRLDKAPRATTSTTASPTTTAAPTTTVAPTTVPPVTAPAPPPPPPAPPVYETAPPPPDTIYVPPPPPPAVTAPVHNVVNGSRDTGCESYLRDQINAARAAVGRPGLNHDTLIQSISVAWSDQMAGRGAISHNPNYGGQLLQYRDWYVAAENVGTGRDLGPLFQAFMNSPEHRQNIQRGDVSHMTVGCVNRGGTYYVTQVFWG